MPQMILILSIQLFNCKCDRIHIFSPSSQYFTSLTQGLSLFVPTAPFTQLTTLLNTALLQPTPPPQRAFQICSHFMLCFHQITPFSQSWWQRLCSMCLWANLLTHPHLEKQVSASPEFLQVQLSLQSGKDKKLYLQQEQVTQNLLLADAVVPGCCAWSSYSHPHCSLTWASSTLQRATWKGRWLAGKLRSNCLWAPLAHQDHLDSSTTYHYLIFT